MKVAGKIFIGIAVLGISGLGYMYGPRLAGDVDAVMLQRHAESACRCERHRGSGARKACWADFEKEFAAKHPKTGLHSFCEAVIHPDKFVWTDNGIEHQITTRYTIDILPGGPLTLCNKAEAGAVEKAVAEDWDRHGSITPATQKLMRDIAHGRPFASGVFDAPSCG
ncbi:MAG: hypothetical protein ABI240_13070 [Sphingomonas sp.]